MPPHPMTRLGSGARRDAATTDSGRGHNRAAIHFHGGPGVSTLTSADNPAASASPNPWACSPARPSLRIHGAVVGDMAGVLRAGAGDVNDRTSSRQNPGAQVGIKPRPGAVSHPGIDDRADVDRDTAKPADVMTIDLT